MKLNLDTLKTEIDSYLRHSGFVVFYGMSRSIDDTPEIDWDTAHYPDYKQFLDVAKELGARLVVLHHREFDSEIIDRALDQLEGTGVEYEDGRHIEARLRELNMYDGFTCVIELSFDYQDVMYMFELRTEWYNELNDILEQLDMAPDDDTDDDETFGGYYSKN
jgi:hypothetical protein